ncbi:response regulator [Geobacter sp. SVR]|uniref:response regulator n=1 Tax=Geobacter sp. SVR TaxID=2495594 RepID=UPI00143EFB89|nr:response regulator [Geobacter sp. SVR]BCS55677.1 histidine kinase [Geobacter sp. SVR]GCF83681.1 histidine kinase [Geobacter sp. SVR]
MNGTRVLIIDDEPMVRSSLAIFLEDIGCHVLQAGHGSQGLDIFFRDRPDLVLTDLRMPILDGFGVVERLAAEAPEIPVIVVSGIGNIREAIHAMHLGAWDYISKPLEELEELEITARRVLERARLLKENSDYRLRLEDLVSQRTRQLAESEQRFHQLFLQHDDAILLCRGGKLEIFEMNRAACTLFGYTGRELIQGGLPLVIAPEELPMVSAGLAGLSDGDIFLREQISAITKDGSRLTVSIKGWRVVYDGTVMHYCSMRDMGAKIRAQQEARLAHSRLIQANKMSSLGLLVSGMAHEINNPNNFIGVNAALLQDIWGDMRPLLTEQGRDQGITLGGLALDDAAETGAGLIAGIIRGSERIAAVVKGLKDFSRKDPAGLEGVIDIRRVISDARTILDHHIQARTDHFEIDCSDDLPSVRGSQQQIEQVLINLLINALQALPDRSRGVRVSASHDEPASEVLLAVNDQGCGMEADTLSKLTEPFFSTRISEGGTGLGLTISSTIIRDHGGTLSFLSEPGTGTVATVRLPAERP